VKVRSEPVVARIEGSEWLKRMEETVSVEVEKVRLVIGALLEKQRGIGELEERQQRKDALCFIPNVNHIRSSSEKGVDTMMIDCAAPS
jgi:hypothetical protein